MSMRKTQLQRAIDKIDDEIRTLQYARAKLAEQESKPLKKKPTRPIVPLPLGRDEQAS